VEIAEMNLLMWGLILDILGVFIITITTIKNPWHSRREDLKWWNKKRYCWNGWRPFYKNTKTLKWAIRWNRKPIVDGIIPLKYKLDIIGLLLILIGFVLQLIFYLV